MSYNPWPLGKLPPHWRRPDFDELLKESGMSFPEPRSAISIFENIIAEYTGAKYAVSVDCCSHGLFLCMKLWQQRQVCTVPITIPKRTYLSVPMQILNAGYDLRFEELEWSGCYQLKPLPIYDCAVRFTENMFKDLKDLTGAELAVLSFQIKKRVPIGKGGMILTDNKEFADKLRRMSYDGRDLTVPYPDDDITEIGYHMYMTPEDAARGTLLFLRLLKEQNTKVFEDMMSFKDYKDLTTNTLFSKI